MSSACRGMLWNRVLDVRYCELGTCELDKTMVSKPSDRRHNTCSARPGFLPKRGWTETMHTKNMTRMTVAFAVSISLFALGTQCLALPSLQLDTTPGTWVGNSPPAGQTKETTVASADTFTVTALMNGLAIGDTFYISAAVIPQQKVGANLGSFVFAGQTIDVTADMVYGVPPIVAADDDLQSHGIFETYFAEFAFTFSAAQTKAAYNVQDDTSARGSLYFKDFEVDVSGLADGYGLHFDLYHLARDKKGKLVIDEFAPFSHDAESDLVHGGGGGGDPRLPDSGYTLVLLGLGFLSLAGVRGRRHLGAAMK